MLKSTSTRASACIDIVGPHQEQAHSKSQRALLARSGPSPNEGPLRPPLKKKKSEKRECKSQSRNKRALGRVIWGPHEEWTTRLGQSIARHGRLWAGTAPHKFLAHVGPEKWASDWTPVPCRQGQGFGFRIKKSRGAPRFPVTYPKNTRRNFLNEI